MNRPTHIENYLLTHRTGQWFGWSDYTNKVHANLVVYDGGAKPSESDCTTGLTNLQTAWDLENNSYKSKRAAEYAPLKEQLDLLYKDMLADKGDKTGEWFKAIKKVKDDNAKD